MAPGELAAHPLHTSMTHLEVMPNGSLSLRLRAFADDFSAAVARATGARVGEDYTVPNEAVARYVANAVRIRVGGRVVPLSLVRQRRDADVTWIEFSAAGVRTLAGALVENRLLMELHADQVNVLKVRGGDGDQTLLFSRGSEPRLLR
jgi:hypothetical protein